MARRKKDPLDALIEQTYYKYGSGVEISVMDIGNIFQAGRAAHAAGTSLDDAIKEAIAKYRKN